MIVRDAVGPGHFRHGAEAPGTWKADLIKEIETAAENRAEMAIAKPEDPRIEQSQKALFDLEEQPCVPRQRR